MSYQKAINLPPSQFKRLCGVSLKTFWRMVDIVKAAKQGSRGVQSKLSIPEQILLTLQYLREYRTFFHIAQDWGIHESTAYRIVKRIEDILIQAEEFRLPGRKQLQESETEIEVIVVDATEVEVERPKKNKRVITVASKSVTPSKCN